MVKPYEKPPLSLQDQISLLESRNMTIAAPGYAAEFLRRVNYYRFVGYGLPFELWGKAGERLDRYRDGTKFEDIVALHEFDSQLRQLLWKYIEHIEIAFRTIMCLELSTRTNNAFWYNDRDMFEPARDFKREDPHQSFLDICMNEFNRPRSEHFIMSYKAKYSNKELPPCWMLIEIVPFGSWSKAYSRLRDTSLRSAIAGNFGTHPKYLLSWIRSTVVLRNLCAHHLRVWNRTFTIAPEISKKMKPRISRELRIAAIVFTLSELLAPLGKARDFAVEFNQLLDSSPFIDTCEMGFAVDRLLL
jgi:abortive infection bacteriophage resistance protein